MKAQSVAVVLAIGCLLLGGVLWYRHSVAIEEQDKQITTIHHFSNELSQVKTTLDDQRAVNQTLERALVARTDEVKVFSNDLASVSASLGKVQIEAKAAADAADAEVKLRDQKIKELEVEREGLTKRMTDLNGSLTQLEGAITETQRKLAASEGDREFLMKELKRLQSEKAELERRFQDLASLRQQITRLNDELSITRKIDVLRRTLYGAIPKGAELLQKGIQPGTKPEVETTAPAPAASAPAPKPRVTDLDVELGRDGGVKIAPQPPVPMPRRTQ